MVRYTGNNILFIDGYKIKAGMNEIKDEDFYKLMKSKTFKYRVEKKIIEVPASFPLEKPATPKKPEAPKDSSSDNVDESDKDEGDADSGNFLSVKALLKLIDKSEDKEYLQGLIEKETRAKVVEAAQKKLDSLK